MNVPTASEKNKLSKWNFESSKCPLLGLQRISQKKTIDYRLAQFISNLQIFLHYSAWCCCLYCLYQFDFLCGKSEKGNFCFIFILLEMFAMNAIMLFRRCAIRSRWYTLSLILREREGERETRKKGQMKAEKTVSSYLLNLC